MVYLALSITVLMWGVSFVATKVVLTYLTPIPAMALRFGLAGVAFLLLFLWFGRPRFSFKTHLLVFLTAFFEPIAYFLFETFGLSYTSATKASIIIAAVPIAVIVVARILLKEPATKRAILGAVASAAGLTLLILADPQVQLEQGIGGRLLGDLLILGAVLSAAFYITLARHLTQRYRPEHITGVQILWGTVVFGLLWWIIPTGTVPLTLESTAWVGLGFLALGATVIAFLLYNYALRHLNAGVAGLAVNGVPVVTTLTGWLFLGETLAPLQLVGAAIVIASVTYVAWRSGGKGSARPSPLQVEG